MLLSAAEYLALTAERPRFVEALAALRAELEVGELGIGDEVFDGLRDGSPRRQVTL